MSKDTREGLTTAEILSRFWKELEEGGIPSDLAHQLVLSAGRESFSAEGFSVKGGDKHV